MRLPPSPPLYGTLLDTFVGRVSVVVLPDGTLWSCGFEGPDGRLPVGVVEDPVATADVAAQVAAYFQGERRTFDVRRAQRGTSFQRRVWDAITAIPFGCTASYGEIAASLGRPGAARAVGQAAGSNPCPIVVPCHRVVASGGRLGGFSGGLFGGTDVKERLLAFEGAAIRPTRPAA